MPTRGHAGALISDVLEKYLLSIVVRLLRFACVFKTKRRFVMYVGCWWLALAIQIQRFVVQCSVSSSPSSSLLLLTIVFDSCAWTTIRSSSCSSMLSLLLFASFNKNVYLSSIVGGSVACVIRCAERRSV